MWGVLGIREPELGLSDLRFIERKDSSGFERPDGGAGRHQDFALGLAALVDILDPLVDARRLAMRGPEMPDIFLFITWYDFCDRRWGEYPGFLYCTNSRIPEPRLLTMLCGLTTRESFWCL